MLSRIASLLWGNGNKRPLPIEDDEEESTSDNPINENGHKSKSKKQKMSNSESSLGNQTNAHSSLSQLKTDDGVQIISKFTEALEKLTSVVSKLEQNTTSCTNVKNEDLKNSLENIGKVETKENELTSNVTTLNVSQDTKSESVESNPPSSLPSSTKTPAASIDDNKQSSDSNISKENTESKEDKKENSSETKDVKVEEVRNYEMKMPPNPKALHEIEDDGYDEMTDSLKSNLFVPLMNKDQCTSYGLGPKRFILLHGVEEDKKLDLDEFIFSVTHYLSKIYQKDFKIYAKLPHDKFGRYDYTEAEKFMKNLCETAKKNTPCLLFLQEIQNLFPHCSLFGTHSSASGLIANINNEMEKTDDLFVISTVDDLTNLSTHMLSLYRVVLKVQVGKLTPNVTSRIQFIKNITSTWNPPMEQTMVQFLADKTDGLNLKIIEEQLKNWIQNEIVQHARSPVKCKKCEDDPNSWKLKENPKLTYPTQDEWAKLFDTVKESVAKEEETKAAANDTNKISDYQIDPNINFDTIGGLTGPIEYLKENVILPLKLKEELTSWGVEPLRGVIFAGPPGTGKTLMAKALATEISKIYPNQKFSFIYRKATDCSNMFMGESERSIREVFALATKNQPSIVFFDEIDALCLARGDGGNERYHTSIVTTMLTEIENLQRGKVLFIAASNRLESLDPSLRRPGRLDKVVQFLPPDTEGRKKILEIHTRKWLNGKDDKILEEISTLTPCFTGADLEQLCRQTFLIGMLSFDKSKKETTTTTDAENNELKIELSHWKEALLTMRATQTNTFGTSYFDCNSKIPSNLLTTILHENITNIGKKLEEINGQDADIIKSLVIWGTTPIQSNDIENFLIPSLFKSQFGKNLIPYQLEGTENLTRESIDNVFKQALQPIESKKAVIYVSKFDKIIQELEYLMKKIENLRWEKNVLIILSIGVTFGNLPNNVQQILTWNEKFIRINDLAIKEFFTEKFEMFPQIVSSASEGVTGKGIGECLRLHGILEHTLGKILPEDITNDEWKNNMEKKLQNIIKNFMKTSKNEGSNLDIYI